MTRKRFVRAAFGAAVAASVCIWPAEIGGFFGSFAKAYEYGRTMGNCPTRDVPASLSGAFSYIKSVAERGICGVGATERAVVQGFNKAPYPG